GVLGTPIEAAVCAPGTPPQRCTTSPPPVEFAALAASALTPGRDARARSGWVDDPRAGRPRRGIWIRRGVSRANRPCASCGAAADVAPPSGGPRAVRAPGPTRLRRHGNGVQRLRSAAADAGGAQDHLLARAAGTSPLQAGVPGDGPARPSADRPPLRSA